MLKNKKLFKGLCIPAAALATVTTLGACMTLASCGNTEKIVGDYVINFDAGNGKFVSNTQTKIGVNKEQTLDKVIQPCVESNVPGELFAGWVDEAGQTVPGQYAFTKNEVLKASYVNGVTGQYITIKFANCTTSGSETKATFHGNTTIAVKNGYRFFMVNRPTATWDKKIFKGWALSTAPTTVIAPDYQFSSDVTLVPVFTDELTFTYHGNGATLKRGNEEVSVESGSTFGDVNQPSYSNGTKLFMGWYKDAACTDANKWSDSETVVDGKLDAYAKWVDEPAELYCTIHYVQGQSTIVPSFSSDEQNAKKTSKWKEINQPTVTTTPSDYEVTGWKYAESSTATTWTDVTDEMVLNYTDLYVYPVLTSSATGVTIVGETSLLPEASSTYTALVLGATTQTVTWKVYSDSTCQTEATDASITAAGVLTLGNITTAKSLYVKATSTVNTAKSQVLTVSVVMPYTNSDLIWYNNGTHWYSITQDDACTTGTTITQTQINTTTTSTITKATSFTYKLYFGTNIYTTPISVFNDFTGFNGDIDLGNVQYIYNDFLVGCTAFNKSLNFKNVKWIANGFLSCCTAYNTAIDFSTATSLEGVGDEFLYGCTAFNQTITLPTTATFQYIGQSFLAGCTAFTKDLTLPVNITEILGFFMTDCKNYTGTLTVNCPVSVFAGEYTQDFMSVASDGAIYTTGYNVAGTYATQFWNKFIDIADATTGCYRRRVSQSFSTSLTASTVTVTGSADSYTFAITSGSLTSRVTSYTLSLTPTHTGSTITSGNIYVKVTAITDASGQTFAASYAGGTSSTIGNFAYDASTAQSFTVYLKDSDGNAVYARGNVTITLSLTTTA